MFDLLKSMLKEEIRLHEALFDRRFFFAFPVAIVGMAYFISYVFGGIFENLGMAFFVFVGLFFVYGLMVGAVGLHAKDALSIRFNDLSLILYSSRTLPVSRLRVFFTFAVQDLVYYFLLTLLPFSVGFYLAGSPVSFVGCVLVFFAAFFFGMSMSFLFSALYSRIGRSVIFFLAVGAYGLFVSMTVVFIDVVMWFISFDVMVALKVIAVSFLVLCVSGLLFDFEGGMRKSRRFGESFSGYTRFFSRFSGLGARPYLASKDMIDMGRTSGGFSKIVFSYLFPSAILWLFFDVFLYAIGVKYSVVTFAVVLGVISTSIYNWLCQYDRFSGYSIYPVRMRDVIVSKMVCFALLSSGFSVAALFGVCIIEGSFSGFGVGLIVMAACSSYVLAVLVRVAGLEPNAVLYDVRVLVRYFAYCLPVLICLSVLSFFDVSSVGGALVLACVLTFVLALRVFRSALRCHDA